MSANRISATVTPVEPGPDPLLSEWQTLVQGMPDAALTHDPVWVSVIEEELAPGGAHRCVVRDGGTLVGVLPVSAKRQTYGKWNVAAAGMPYGSPVDLADVVISATHRTGAALDAAFRAMGSELGADIYVFNRVRTRSCLVSALASGGFSLSHYLADAGQSAYCDVSTPEALKSVSSDQLRNVDRLHRRAVKEHGDVTVQTFAGATVDDDAFQRFLEIEASGWKGQEGTGTALAIDTAKQRFYHKLLTRFGAADRARIDFITIGGVPAAAHLAIRTGPTWSLLKIGYDPAFKAYGPGGILLRLFIDEMVANPEIREVNLTTNPKWAERWHFHVEPVYNVMVFGRTLRGRGLAAERFAKEMVKRVRSRVPRTSPTSNS